MFQDIKNEMTVQRMPITSSSYKIKPLDNLYISVLTLDPEVNKLFNPSMAGTGAFTGTQQMYGSQVSQYINGYRVSNNGSIDLPILGILNLAGLTLDEAQDKLEKKALEYLQEPEVQIKLLNFRVNISGEVKTPGLYYNYEGNLNIIDAISMANGITDYADLKNVIITRYYQGVTNTYKINITKKDILTSDIFFLKNNDLVYIPPNKLKRRQENNSTYSLILATISTILVALALVK